MADVNKCAECGTLLPEKGPAGGLCPKCLIQQGLSSRAATRSAGGAGARFEAPAPADLAGRFPQLEILELIGQGGMGAVYKARQRKLDRLVALKIIAPHRVRDVAFAERFGREARTLARLSHPNVVGIHDFGEIDELYYFIMEYVDGANLREVMHGGRLTPTDALALVPQICDALQFAHECGVVHRDIKPENILLDNAGRVKIADFGLAKLLEPEQGEDVSLTASGAVLGTPVYMAPEQIEHPLQVDHRADIYAVGVVFYEMLTGELPLGRFEPPSSRVQLDVRFDQVVLRALEKDAKRRYQLASDVKADLERFDGRQEAGSPSPASRTDQAAASPSTPSPNPPRADAGSRTLSVRRPRLVSWIAGWAFAMAAFSVLATVVAAASIVLVPSSVLWAGATSDTGYQFSNAGPVTWRIGSIFVAAAIALSFVATIGYTLSGFGLLQLRRWARLLLIVVCVVELLTALLLVPISPLMFLLMIIPSIVLPVLVIVYLSKPTVIRIFELGLTTVTLPTAEADALERSMGAAPW